MTRIISRQAHSKLFPQSRQRKKTPARSNFNTRRKAFLRGEKAGFFSWFCLLQWARWRACLLCFYTVDGLRWTVDGGR
jgi:hypothetical protein